MNKYAELLTEVMDGHADPESADYNECDTEPCQWCIEAKAAAAEIEQAEPSALLVRLYNTAYHAGHHDTVEGQYTDVLPVDMDSYHDDVVAEIVQEWGIPAPVAPAVPEGWKLVPVKPTEEMIEAVRGRARFPRAWELVDSDYRDMLSASPEPEEKQ